MEFSPCMTCRRHYEIKSLRASVERLESDHELSSLKEALDKANRKITVLKEENDRLKKERNQLKNDQYPLKKKIEILQEENRKLVEKLRSLHDECSFEDLIESSAFQDRIDHLVLLLLSDIDQMKAEKEELMGQITKLTAQIHKDFSNSSKPSSQCPNRKKIQNNREKTDRRPGGQIGHKGHPRKQLESTEQLGLPLPEEVKQNPGNYEFVEFKSRKQADIVMNVVVKELISAVFRDKITGKEVWYEFPDGYENEMNYGPALKAFCCFSNNYLNVSLRKISSFLSDLTERKIEIAPSTIFKLTREFGKLTKDERGQIFRDLMNSPYMHNDATTIRVDGKQYFVYVSSNGKDVLYQFREHKGEEGIKGTPVENYLFVLIHDHDVTYFKYGGAHQKCIVHEQRYVKGSEDNEPELNWNKQMDEHLKWIIHNFKEGNLKTEESVKAVKDRYYEILELAMKEYATVPESRLKYYKEGYNTAKRLKEYGESLLYFLEHPEIPYSNNECERRARRIKGRLRTIGTFRSFQSAIDYLKFMSSMETERDTIDNKYAKLVEVFS